MALASVLVDSSFLIALFDKDTKRRDVQAIAKLYARRLLIPQVVLTEVAYFLKREIGVRGAAAFLREFNDSQPDLQDVTVDDLRRVREIMLQYEESRFDFVDCCIMALAERLNITQVCTLDYCDFGIFRPVHCDYLEILP